METQSKKSTKKTVLLIFNIMLLSIGTCASPLIMRLYFLHGGKRIWFTSWLQTGAWPVILIPITISYLDRRRSTDSSSSQPSKFFLMKPRVFFAAAVIGTLTGLDDYLYSYGVARLPVSTSSLIIASQLAFTAAFAFFLVKQKFTSYTLNAVFLLTIGAVVLALHTNSDRPNNESTRQYLVGFLMTLGASFLYGLILPMMELTYKKARQEINYALVLEIQMVMCLFATLFSTVGMVINKDFQYFDLGTITLMSGWERDEYNRLRRILLTKLSSHSISPIFEMADEPIEAGIGLQPIPLQEPPIEAAPIRSL